MATKHYPPKPHNLEMRTVLLKAIVPPTDIQHYDPDSLEKLTNTILDLGVVLHPMVLKPLPMQEGLGRFYRIMDGHFQYQAAMAAYRQNPHFEAINAWVIPDEAWDICVDICNLSDAQKNALQVQLDLFAGDACKPLELDLTDDYSSMDSEVCAVIDSHEIRLNR